MSQTIGKVRPAHPSRSSIQLHSHTPSAADTARLRAHLAPRLGVSVAAHARAAVVAHRTDPDGQAQADLGPVERLRRLRGGDGLRAAEGDGPQATAEDVLLAHDAARQPQEPEPRAPHGQVGRRRGPAPRRPRNAAQE